MKTASLLVCSLITLGLATGLHAQSGETDPTAARVTDKCTFPQQPAIPDGDTATEAELIEAREKMMTYLEEGQAFNDCLHEVEATWTEEEKKEKSPYIVQFHNRMVDNMHEVAELFNTALRAFKARN